MQAESSAPSPHRVHRVLALVVCGALLGTGGTCNLVDPDEGAAQRRALQVHVLNRIGYGPDAWSLARIEELGIPAYIQEQLHPETIDDSEFEARVAAPWTSMSYPELVQAYPDVNQLRLELQRTKLLRAVYSRRQLEAVLTDFWYNHFNVDMGSGRHLHWDIAPYERDAIRANVLGSFRDMLEAVSRSPAMLEYLDNWLNTKPGIGSPDNPGINENYGREILELHTLGVNGGYDQDDVIEVARILTGWTYHVFDGFQFAANLHDQGPKQVMGELVVPPNGGMQDGFDLFDFLAYHPATALRVSRQLCERFVSESCPPELVVGSAFIYVLSGSNLRTVMSFLLDAVPHGTPVNGKVKRPLHYVASALRALGATNAEAEVNSLLQDLETMGEWLYRAGPPTGHPEASEHWSQAGGLLERFNTIHRVVFDPAIGADLPVLTGSAAEVVDGLVPLLLPEGIPDAARAGVVDFVQSIASDSDANRTLEAAAMLLSTPAFLRH